MSPFGTGKQGETLAAAALTGAGLHIIEKNFRSRRGEVDIIARDGEFLVFIEVKSWAHYDIGDLEKSITRKKQERIIETAKYFMSLHREYSDMKVRFDIIFIGNKGIKHLESAFVE